MITNAEDISQLGTILGVWAHPDDETYSMAGIMAAAVQNGQTVVCVTATRGEAGVQDESRWPSHKLADIRTKESDHAFDILGVTDHFWLDYPDGGCAAADSTAAASCIVEYIKQYQPDSIFTFGPDGMTGHSDHKTVSAWASEARSKAKSQARIYHAVQTKEQYENMQEVDKLFNVFFAIDKPPIHEDTKCSVCYKLEPDIYTKKLQALRAMPSQTEAMLKMFETMLEDSVGIEAFRLFESD